MKAKTRRLKELNEVSKWLEKARPDIEKATVTSSEWQPEFSLLIAVEQLVRYLKLLEDKHHD